MWYLIVSIPEPCCLSYFYRCIVALHSLWLFLTVPWVGLQYVIVVFPDHTHLLFYLTTTKLSSAVRSYN